MIFLNELNQQQLEAVKATNGPVMVIAGAGSGKTRVLTYRIAYLIRCGVPVYQILALTFTNKAANEMKERIGKLVGSESAKIWMGTFHSVLARILRIECEKLGYEKYFTIYDEIDSLGAVKKIMGALGIPAQQFNPQAVRSRISRAKNDLVTPEEYAKQAGDLFAEKTAKVYAEYRLQLKRNNAMDFDDLLLKPIELFQHHKKILDKYQDRFRFILVDEYQDTNRAQYFLIKLLASKYKNICVVGDDAQSIYSFRGADIRNILDFEHDYPDAQTFRLEQNYRSTKTILAAADRVIKNNVDQIAKNLWTDNHPGEPITVLFCDDDRDEGAQVVHRIFEDSRSFKIDLNNFAVLYRTNAQSRSLEDALRKNNIPYVIVGGIEFYQRKEIKDVLAYLRVLTNPQDDESLQRIMNYPNRGIGDVTIARLKSFAGKKGLNLFEALAHSKEVPGLSERAKNGLLGLSKLFKKYREFQKTASITECSRALVDEIGILQLFKDDGTPEAIARWENVQELLSAVSEYSTDHPDARLTDFLEEISLVSDVDRWDDKHNTVTLMTLHSAKGLEFPVVFVTGLEEGLLPLYNSTLERTELEEERRLFYVGMTRAMKKLYLSHTRVRYRFGEVTYPTPSRFIDEVGEGLIEKRSPSKTLSVGKESQKGSAYRVKSRKAAEQKREQYFSDEIPDYENMSEENSTLTVGSVVEHETFGKGILVHISVRGENTKVTVDFISVGRKNLLVKYAKLKTL